MAVARLFWSGGGEVNFQGRYYRIEGGRLNTPFIAPDRTSPEIFVGGSSEQAARLAARHADCLWRFPDVEERLAPEIRPVLEAGKEVGLLVSLIARPTRQEALAAAEALVAPFPRSTREIHRAFAARSDSHGFRANYALAEGDGTAWLGRCLWTGAIPYLGAGNCPGWVVSGDYRGDPGLPSDGGYTVLVHRLARLGGDRAVRHPDPTEDPGSGAFAGGGRPDPSYARSRPERAFCGGGHGRMTELSQIFGVGN